MLTLELATKYFLEHTGETVTLNTDWLAEVSSYNHYKGVRSIYQAPQYFCNAYLQEMALYSLNKDVLDFYPSKDAHTILSDEAATESRNKPDFIFISGELAGKTLEVKICASDSEADLARVKNKAHAEHADYLWIATVQWPKKYLAFMNTGAGFRQISLSDLPLVFPSSIICTKLIDNEDGTVTIDTFRLKNTLRVLPVKTCQKCGRRLTAAGECPVCDLGDETFNEVLEISSDLGIDFSKALANKEEYLPSNRYRCKYVGSTLIEDFYIMPDASVIKSANQVNISSFLTRNNYIRCKVKEYTDAPVVTDECNIVGVGCYNDKEVGLLSVILLPENQLTAAQYTAVANWIEWVLTGKGELALLSKAGLYKQYSSEVDLEKVMRDIHKFYRTVTLNNFEYELLEEPKIESIDYELKANLKKGFYDQF